MGLFSKLFMSLGFGEAKIETIFDDDSVRQGGDLTGIICLRGGSSDIKFDGIFVELFGEYLSGEEDDVVLETAKIGELQLAEDFVLEEDADVELPFSLSLPPNAPITTKDLLSEDDKSNVYMRTSLKVDFADDPEDFDRINVYPSREVETVILALTQGLEFALIETQTILYHDEIIQEFEFVPREDSDYKKYLDEIECYFFHVDGGIKVCMEIDKRVRNFSTAFLDAFDMDETYKTLFIPIEDLQEGPTRVAILMDRFIYEYAQ